MSLFASPEEHAIHPPESWVVEKVVGSPRHWQLRAGISVLEHYDRKRDAEAAKVKGFYFDQYAKEARWYAGETVSGWKPYAQCLAERR